MHEKQHTEDLGINNQFLCRTDPTKNKLDSLYVSSSCRTSAKKLHHISLNVLENALVMLYILYCLQSGNTWLALHASRINGIPKYGFKRENKDGEAANANNLNV